MPRVGITNFGTIPARTRVEIIGGIPFPTKDVVVDASKLTKQYGCMDCSYKTTDVDEMLDHQLNHSKHHNFWQRLKRWWHYDPDCSE